MNIHPEPRLDRCLTKTPHTPPEGTPAFVSPEIRILFCDECKGWTEHRRAVDYDRQEKAYECRDCGNQIIYFINYEGIEL